VPMHVHVAEDRADVEDAKQRGYDGPLERLIALDALPTNSILAHCVWLDEAQVKRANEAGAWIVQNPRSNANNRVGYPRALHASTRVAIGTDGFAADMDEEHRALGEEAKKNGDPASASVLNGRRVGGFALVETFFPTGHLDNVVGAPPREVVVGGRSVVEDGRLVHADLEEIRAHAREQATRLWSRMQAL